MGLEKWAGLAPEKKFILSEESAKAELGRLCTYYDVSLDDVPSESEAAINQIFSRLLSAFREGRLELADDPEKGLSVIQTLKKGDKLTYREIRGSDKAKLDTVGNEPTRRLYYLAGLLSGYGADVIGKLPSSDLKVIEGLSGFFLTLC